MNVSKQEEFSINTSGNVSSTVSYSVLANNHTVPPLLVFTWPEKCVCLRFLAHQ